MADTLELELVSPEKLLFSQAVSMAIVPGSEGDIGVLPGHAPVISSVRPGVIAIFENGTVSMRIFVAGGFLEVSDDRCTVLAEGAVPMEDLDRASIEREIAILREDVARPDGEMERRAAEAALAVAEMKLHLLEHPPY